MSGPGEADPIEPERPFMLEPVETPPSPEEDSEDEDDDLYYEDDTYDFEGDTHGEGGGD